MVFKIVRFYLSHFKQIKNKIKKHGGIKKMKKYFENCNNLDEVKKEYRRLAKLNHPDIGGSEATMKDINSQYDQAINNMKDTTSTKKAESQVYEADLYRDIINELIKYRELEIEICGWFIWISGNTKPYKDQIKKLGFRWASKKCQWYHKPDWYFSKNRSEWSMDDIRNKYGSEKIKKTENEKQKQVS